MTKSDRLRRKAKKLLLKADELETRAQRLPKNTHLTKIRIPEYSVGEEIFNAVSHGVGALLAIAALTVGVVKSTTVIGTVSMALYGSIMIVLYVISCIYHALSKNLNGKKVLRVIDHCNVMLMVAGTYIPISLSLIGGSLGWWIFSIVWAITIPAVVFNAIDVDKYSLISVICNLVLGWGALFCLPALQAHCPWLGIWLLLAGGIVYTLGSVLYSLGAKKKWMHSIFHLFVLAASALHYFFILFYCI